jgi:hypothetical protein
MPDQEHDKSSGDSAASASPLAIQRNLESEFHSNTIHPSPQADTNRDNLNTLTIPLDSEAGGIDPGEGGNANVPNSIVNFIAHIDEGPKSGGKRPVEENRSVEPFKRRKLHGTPAQVHSIQILFDN